MTVNELILNTLKPLGVPVGFQTVSQTADTYITYFCYLEQNTLYADDVENAKEFYVQVDIWSKENYSNIVERVKSAMKVAGFIFLDGRDLYENGTKIYHKALRFYYMKEVE